MSVADGATPPPGDLRIAWLTDGERLPELTALFLRAVHDRYMSHGDLMEGRAVAPGTWAEDLASLHAREVAGVQLDGGPFARRGQRIALAELDGVVRGFASVARVDFDAGRPDPVRYARLDDIVVEPAERGHGIGSALIDWVASELREAGVDRLFLESGIDNTDAHRLFARHGFTITSVTMLKEL